MGTSPHQNAITVRLELVAEPAPETVDGGVVTVAGGQAFATSVPGDLLQACELCLGLACGTVDQTTEGVITGAERFVVPMCAAEPIAGGPPAPFVSKRLWPFCARRSRSLARCVDGPSAIGCRVIERLLLEMDPRQPWSGSVPLAHTDVPSQSDRNTTTPSA